MLKESDAISGMQIVDYMRIFPKIIVELEAFLQTWLFFGLLTEILGDAFVPLQFLRSPVGPGG